MGRLFWKFFVAILLAQLAATVGIGGALWIKHRQADKQQLVTIDLDTGPPAELSINAAAATLQFGGPQALRDLLANMEHDRVYVVDEKDHELLDRIVSAPMLAEARYLLKKGSPRVVRQISDKDGHSYLLFLPSRAHQQGLDAGEPPPLAALVGQASLRLPAPRMGRGPGPAPHGDGPVPQDQGPGEPPPGAPPHAGPGGPGGPPPPAGFQPLTPFVPLAAAVVASLLVAMLLAWYFSRPIRELRLAFEAAAGGDLAPRFAGRSGRRGKELNDLGRDFDRMTGRLRSLIDGQTRLLHDVSHELRSPLARLQAAIGLAHQQPDKMAASMERIERESVRMDKLVGQLLTLARLEAGALDTMQEEIGMADLLEQIAGDANFEAAAQNRTVVMDGEADVLVLGQTELLGRAIENVVRNGVKHSPDGGVARLQTRILPATRQLQVRVLDRGPGVAPDELETIFQPFFRSNDTDHSTDGHGLGLAIARQVILAHGGSIAASNRPDGGLCVEIVLPVAQPAA